MFTNPTTAISHTSLNKYRATLLFLPMLWVRDNDLIRPQNVAGKAVRSYNYSNSIFYNYGRTRTQSAVHPFIMQCFKTHSITAILIMNCNRLDSINFLMDNLTQPLLTVQVCQHNLHQCFVAFQMYISCAWQRRYSAYY